LNGVWQIERAQTGALATPASAILLKWRLRAYARVAGNAVARHAKTLALVVGLFVFGLPLEAQLDLLSLPVAVVLTHSGSGWSQALVLTSLSALATAWVAVQGGVVFGGASRRWTVSLPGGSAAHSAADLAVVGTALWPFWIMLIAAIVRHSIGSSGIEGWTFAIGVGTLPLLWIGAPLAVIARSRAAAGAVASGNVLLWFAAHYSGALALWCGIAAFGCSIAALRLPDPDIFLEREHYEMTLLRRGSSVALIWTVLMNRYGHSLRLGGLMLFTMGALSTWFVSMPDYASRSWGIANLIMPFILYQIATLHDWLRNEADRQTGWFASLPRAISMFKRSGAVSVIVLSLLFTLAIGGMFAIVTGSYWRYAGAFAFYVGLSIAFAMCRWWGPRKSRLIDSVLMAGCGFTCYSVL
jgi:hypothetical protein